MGRRIMLIMIIIILVLMVSDGRMFSTPSTLDQRWVGGHMSSSGHIDANGRTFSSPSTLDQRWV